MTGDTFDMSTLVNNFSPVFWKKGRLETFKYWPFDDNVHCNADRMASAGFYCVGGKKEPDLVECFMCKKQLDGWEESDDPWEEHKNHQQNCQFIQIGKSAEDSLTLKEFYQLMITHYHQKIKLEMENAVQEVKEEWKNEAETLPSIIESMKKRS